MTDRLTALRTRAARLTNPVTVGAGAAALLLLRIFFPATSGLADNSDGTRLMCQLALDKHLIPGLPAPNKAINNYYFYSYVWYRYDHFPTPVAAAHHFQNCDYTYPSSQLVLLHATRFLTKLFGLPGSLDLRVLGVLVCLIMGVAIGILYAGLRTRKRWRLAVCALLLVILADSVFVDYFISPYSEVAGLIGVMFMIAGAPHLSGRGTRQRVFGLVVVTFGGVFAMTSKMQMVTLAIPLVILVLAHRVPVGRWKGKLSGRAVPLAALVIVAVSAVVFSPNVPRLVKINRHNFFFTSLLPHSSNAGQALKEVGATPDLAVYAGSNYWCTQSDLQAGYNDPQKAHAADPGVPGPTPYYTKLHTDYSEMFSKNVFSYGHLTKYLVQHPGLTAKVMQSTANDFFKARPEYAVCETANGRSVSTQLRLGNYGFGPNTPQGKLDHKFAIYSFVLSWFVGAGLYALIPIWLIIAYLGYRGMRRGRAAAIARQLGELVLFLFGIAVVQYVTATFGDGIDTVKHMHMSIFATGVAFLFGVAALVVPRGDDPEPETPAVAAEPAEAVG